jgi:hypothetical protein
MMRQVANRPYWLPKLQIVGDRQILVGVIAADQPVELVAERRALQAQFLAEGLELARRIIVAARYRMST